MNPATTNDIWVFMDLRSRRLFAFSLNVLCKAKELAIASGGKLVACLLSPPNWSPWTRSDLDGCALLGPPDTQCLNHGAHQVLVLENEAFTPPRADIFASVLADAVTENAPKLVVMALTDFGRELAARVSRQCRGGLIADCKDIHVEAGGRVIGLCPAWGGTIVSEITFEPGWGTGFATVQTHCCKAEPVESPMGEILRRRISELPDVHRLRMSDSHSAPESQQKLELAERVVVGGAGLGSAKAFAHIRELAAVLGAEVGATRPPVLQHWVDPARMIGQTGKRVAPKLLISIGTSGAVQYTAGIMEAGTIVVINRDPDAAIFETADIGIIADANELLPVLIERGKQALMRQLADVLCETTNSKENADGFGTKLQKLRTGRQWSIEDLAEATGQTPDFIQQVEADAVSPPVSFLLRLAGALDVDPGTFLRKETQAAIRDQRIEAYVRRTQNYSYETLTEGSETDHLRAFMVTIEPHHAHKPVAYKHEGEEFVYVMSGELELMIGSTAHVLKAGEYMHFNSFIPHKLKSLSSDPTRCLVVLYTI